MKKHITIFLFVFILFTSYLPGICQDIYSESSIKFEGNGYDSPEEAVLAYIDAFNRGDVFSAVSTFSIESMINNKDSAYYTQRLMMFSPFSNYLMIPTDNAWIHNIEIIKRYEDVVSYLYNQYLMFNNILSDLGMDWNNNHITVRTQGDLNNVINVTHNQVFENWFGNIIFIEWIDPFHILKLAPLTTIKNYSKMYEAYGTEDFMPVIAHIMIGDQNAVIIFDCGKYKDRWYNLQPNGLIGNILDTNTLYGGIVLFSYDEFDDFMSLYEKAKSEPDNENISVIKSHLGSNLTGTFWNLIDITHPSAEDYVIVESFDDLLKYEFGKAVFGQLHFSRFCYSMEIEERPIDTNNRINDRIFDLWKEEDNKITFYDNTNNSSFVEGSFLTVETQNGAILTFEKK